MSLRPLAPSNPCALDVRCDPSRFIHRHLLYLHGFGLGRTAIDVCHGKTVCVPHHVAAGKFVGVPWGGKATSHSITSLASARMLAGNSIPIALAVLRLTTNSNFAACSTGRSSGPGA